MSTTPADERRRKRSNDPLIALHYQLAHARTEGRYDAVVVADGSGVVVAGAGAWATCEELAAYAPLLAQGQWTEPGLDDTSRVAELRARSRRAGRWTSTARLSFSALAAVGAGPARWIAQRRKRRSAACLRVAAH